MYVHPVYPFIITDYLGESCMVMALPNSQLSMAQVEWYFGGIMLFPAQKTFPAQVSVLQITKGKHLFNSFAAKNENTSKTRFFPFNSRRSLVHLPKSPAINGLCEAKKSSANISKGKSSI